MSSRGGSSSSNGGGLQSIPATSRKVVQSLKEIVNCPESEIYATLKECNMDPNEAVNKLLSQDPFHEVKSKREKKKENKDATDFRFRGIGSTPSRGGRGGTDRHVGRGGSAQYSSSEYGAVNGKPSHKKENGTNNYISSSFVVPGMAGNDMNRRPPAHCDPLLTEKKAVGTIDGILSSSQPSSGYQPAWSGVAGQVSMADIVKMGRSHGKASSTANASHYDVSHHIVQAPQSHVLHHDLRLSENHISKVSELNSEQGPSTGYHASPNDDWPLVEQQPAVSVPAVLAPVACELHADASNLSSNRLNQHSQSPQDEFQAVEDAAIENINTNHAGSASVSSRKIQEESSGGASLFNDDMYKSMGSSRPHRSAFEHQEVEDVGASVSSVTLNLQQLSVQGDRETPPEEDNPPVIIPNHLQVQTTECLHLSFGSFGSGSSASFSGSMPLKIKMEEASTDVDASPVRHSETRNLEYYGDNPLRTASDSNLVHRTGVNAGSYDSPSASQPEVLQQENIEAPRENQYIFPSTSNYNFENGQHLNAAFPPQTSSQMRNIPSFPNVTQAYSNSLPSSLLAASVLSARESDVPYSPFPMTQPLSTKYSNTVSSTIGAPAVFMTEALKTAGFASSQPTAQTLPGSGIAAGPALPQHLAVHPYSQPTVPLGPFANMISYPFLPQSYPYMPSAFQQAFAGNSTYHQSLAAVLPQYKNSVSVSSLPQSAAIASGYGGFGTSTSIPSNFQMNPTAASAATSIGYDDVMSSQYKDSNHLISLQQNENSGMWVQGHGSRTMSAVPGSTYYSFQGQSQQPSGFRQTQQQPSQNYGALGYPNFYHSQTGIPMEHQQQNLRDGSLLASQGQQPSKQSQQIWQNSY